MFMWVSCRFSDFLPLSKIMQVGQWMKCIPGDALNALDMFSTNFMYLTYKHLSNCLEDNETNIQSNVSKLVTGSVTSLTVTGARQNSLHFLISWSQDCKHPHLISLITFMDLAGFGNKSFNNIHCNNETLMSFGTGYMLVCKHITPLIIKTALTCKFENLFQHHYTFMGLGFRINQF